MGKNTLEAKQWLDKPYGDSAPGKSTIINWYAEFKRGRTNTNDVERSGRSKSAVVPENVTKVYKIVLGDRKLKLHVIADTLKISEGCLKRPEIQQWDGKVMASVFLDAHGIFFIDYLEKGETINSDYYMALLDRLSAGIMKKRPHIQKKMWLPKLKPILRAKTNRSTKKASKS